MTSITLRVDGPVIAISATQKSRIGNDSTTSVIRISTESTIPPAYPATPPTSTPMIDARPVATTPTSSDTRAPKISRDSTSRPLGSVPSRNDEPGATGAPSADSPLGYAWSGLCGASSGAKTATTASTTTARTEISGTG